MSRLPYLPMVDDRVRSDAHTALGIGTVVWVFPYVSPDGARCSVLFDGFTSPTTFEGSRDLRPIPDAHALSPAGQMLVDVWIVRLNTPGDAIIDQVAALDRLTEARAARAKRKRGRRGSR